MTCSHNMASDYLLPGEEFDKLESERAVEVALAMWNRCNRFPRMGEQKRTQERGTRLKRMTTLDLLG